MPTADPKLRSKAILAFGLVYFFWGSTYLAIAIAVQHIGAALMTGIRFSIAGFLMLAWCAMSGRRIAIARAEKLRLAVIGVLLLSIGNAVLGWAEETLPTGLAALIISITPLWFLMIETWIFRGDHISRRGLAGLVLGIGGIVVLLWPKLNSTSSMGRKELYACLVLQLASMSWAFGSVLSKRSSTSSDVFVASAWQMSAAGLVNLVVAGLLGEYHTAVWTGRGLSAIAYLVVFGSWVGYSAFSWLTRHVDTPKVATYAYINPVVAVFLGWLVLHERVDAFIAAGSAVILAGVALVTSAKVKKQGTLASETELPTCESAGD